MFSTSATYFLGQRLLGSSPAWRIHSESLVYVCTHCGDAWARVFIEPQRSLYHRWLAQYYDCPRCGSGTILTDYAIDQWLQGLAEFPHTLLMYEFLRRST